MTPPTHAYKFWTPLWLGLAVAYCLTGRLCISLSAMVENVSWMPFVPAGLSLTSALLWGRRVWPGVFLGELALVLWGGESLATSALMATGNAVDCALAGWWFHDRLGRRIEFDNVRDVVALMLAELLVLQPLSAAMGMVALAAGGKLPDQQLWTTASAWYAANVFALLLVAPAALSWIRWRRPAQTRREYAELAALFAATVLVGAFAAGRWATYGVPLTVTMIFSLPLLVWGAVRFVPSVPVTLGCVLGLFAFDAVLNGHGNFQGVPIGDRMFYLNVFLAVCIGTAIFLAAAMGQQRRFEAKQTQLIAELQQATQQVRRLEDMVTFCAWTGRVRWQGQWVSVEVFLRERYDVVVSHGISDEAVAQLKASMLEAEFAGAPGNSQPPMPLSPQTPPPSSPPAK